MGDKTTIEWTATYDESVSAASALLVRSDYRVHTAKGWVEAPGVGCSMVPGLAVTMVNFGFFSVTHVASGRAMGGAYERYCDALRDMIEAGAIAQDGGWSWEEQDASVLHTRLNGSDRPVPFPAHSETSHPFRGGRASRLDVGGWFRAMRERAVSLDHDGDDEPFEQAFRVLLLMMRRRDSAAETSGDREDEEANTSPAMGVPHA